MCHAPLRAALDAALDATLPPAPRANPLVRPGRLLATSLDASQTKKRGFNVHWITWRAVCVGSSSQEPPPEAEDMWGGAISKTGQDGAPVTPGRAAARAESVAGAFHASTSHLNLRHFSLQSEPFPSQMPHNESHSIQKSLLAVKRRNGRVYVPDRRHPRRCGARRSWPLRCPPRWGRRGGTRWCWAAGH